MGNEEKHLDEIIDKKLDMASILSFLVKPVKEVEEKIEKIQIEFDQKINQNLHMIDAMAKDFLRYSEKINSMESKPDKLEHRVSAVEGKCQHVEPLKKDADEIKSELKKLFDFNYVVDEGLNKAKRDQSNNAYFHKDHGGRLKKIESSLLDIHSKYDEQRRSIKLMKEEEKDRNTRLQREREQEKEGILNSFTQLRRDIEKYDGVFKGLNSAIERQWKNTGSLLENMKSEFQNKIDATNQSFNEIKSQLRDVKDNVDQKLYRDDDRLETLSKSVEFLEKRADKMGMAMKHMKSEMNI
jgi:chromosome segregation ATPase